MNHQINTKLLIERIDHLCSLKGINRTTAFVESGVGKNFKSNLSTSSPSMGKITMLANYFGVTVDYLLGTTSIPLNLQLFATKPTSLTPEETALLAAYRSKPELAPAVRKLLDVPEEDSNLITAPMAAHSSTYTPIGTESYADKRAGEFANAPDVDTEF